MGKSKEIAKGVTKKKGNSPKKSNQKPAASSRKTAKLSSSKGEGSRTCRASLPLKGKDDKLSTKAQQEASSSESFSTDSDYAEFLLTYDEDKETL
ncbi:hypothetical protein A2U01_0064955, partial [Trifolium medium]|nr:hypothetical protein [Trifolium medium]